VKGLVFRISRGVGRIQPALGARDNELLYNQKENRLAPQIAVFIFKHCFHYTFPIGFVCGEWVRLRKMRVGLRFAHDVFGFVRPKSVCLGSFCRSASRRNHSP